MIFRDDECSVRTENTSASSRLKPSPDSPGYCPLNFLSIASDIPGASGRSRVVAELVLPSPIGMLASGLCFFCSRAAQVAAARRTLASTFSNDSGKSVERGAGDIGDPQTAERAISEGLARFGRIDTLVNNAGIFIAKPFTTYAEADFAAMLATNLAGLFHITQRAIAQMVKQGSGHVINITASLVDQPTQTLPAVLAAVTKGGLNAASRSLAIEYATRGIRVNAVAPGVIKTARAREARRAREAASGGAHRRSLRYRRSRSLPRIRRLRDRRDTLCRWRQERRPLM
jgi:NAD(P)-dependent dehydrogenase (short-subunit alcohol dehydrogenase family)